MKKSGLADSPFFSPSAKEEKAAAPPPAKPLIVQKKTKSNNKKTKSKPTSQSRDDGPMKPRNHDTTVSRYDDDLIEQVRKAVKEFGKEAATHRFTLDEKKAIIDIIYAYKNLGLKTSENEITRIAVNFIVNDYKQHGENSILARALKALNG